MGGGLLGGKGDEGGKPGQNCGIVSGVSISSGSPPSSQSLEVALVSGGASLVSVESSSLTKPSNCSSSLRLLGAGLARGVLSPNDNRLIGEPGENSELPFVAGPGVNRDSGEASDVALRFRGGVFGSELCSLPSMGILEAMTGRGGRNSDVGCRA